MAKKVLTESMWTEYDAETGEVKSQSSHKVAVLPTEEKYFKFYYEGLMYISDMPTKCHKVLYAILENLSYVDHKVEGLDEYGMYIFLPVDVKKGIAASLGFSNYREIDNEIAKLVKGDVIKKIGNGIYRPNPYILARGAWKEICHLRGMGFYRPQKGDTFKTVCKRKDTAKKERAEHLAEQAKHQPIAENEPVGEQNPEPAEQGG